jgi:hypothetical protein
MTTLGKRSFAGGEVAPALYARVDQSKYQTGLKTLRNNYVMKHGGAENRSGLEQLAEVADNTKAVRMIEFVFNDAQTYAIEMGETYFRFYKNGARLEEAAINANNGTQANPCVITATGHTITNGQTVRIAIRQQSGMLTTGMVEIDERDFTVANVAVNTFELQGEDSTSHSVWNGNAWVYEVYELAHPYLEAELFEVDFVQSGDTVTLVHPNHPPAELTRTGDLAWSYDVIEFNPEASRPTGISASGTSGTGFEHYYKITGIDPDTGEESLAGLNTTTETISGITAANPPVVTCTGHSFSDNEVIYIDSLTEMTELNKREFTVVNTTANTLELEGIDASGYTPETSSTGAANSITEFFETTAALSISNKVTLTWTRPTNMQVFNVYKKTGGIYGLLSVVEGDTYEDIGTDADGTDAAPIYQEPFFGAGNYPSTVTYIQQRLAFGNTTNKPETIWLSRTGNFYNFTTTRPIADDASISFNMSGREVNEIRNMIDLRGLVILTSGGEWNASGDSAGTITPTAINTKQYGYSGSSGLKPITTGGSALFVQARGSIIRDLGYNFEADGYAGNDLTIFSSHLFEGYSIIDWGYQQIPHSIIWVVRSDGALLSLTYIKEQQMLAWARHDTDGEFESVTVIPEGSEDVPYFVVKRTINAESRRYVEKFNSRYISAIEDMKLMDANVTWEAETSAATMTITGGTTWESTETLTVTASAGYFSKAYNEGQEVHFTAADGTLLRFSIITYSGPTTVTGTFDKTVPVDLRSTATSNWKDARKKFYGLHFLEGKTVSVLADGYVVGSPNNPDYDTFTVTDGILEIDRCFTKVHIGLPVTADLETLDIDSVDRVLLDESAIVNSVTLFVEESRGIFAGPKKPATDSTTDLTEFKIRETDTYDAEIPLKTGTIDVNIKGEWSDGGRVFIRQVDPLPMTVLAIAPSGKFLTGV